MTKAAILKILFGAVLTFIAWISTMSFDNRERVVVLETNYKHIITGITEIKTVMENKKKDRR